MGGIPACGIYAELPVACHDLFISGCVSSMDPKSEKYPARYGVHKYLGRKPWDLVSEIIQARSGPHDTVFDIYSGSGVAAFEALRLGRNVIAIDHSPISELIVRSLCERCDAEEYNFSANLLLGEIFRMQNLYAVKAGEKTGVLRYWQPRLKRGRIDFNDGSKIIGTFADIEWLFEASPEDNATISELEGRIPELPGNNVHYWRDVFTYRGARVLARARELILQNKNPAVRRALLTALSASIEKVSLLNKPKSEGKSWIRDKPLCYYKSEDFIEFNAVDAVSNKIIAMLHALREANVLLKDGGRFTFSRERIEDMAYTNRADLIIIDPPYLDEVQYGELEAMRGVWLHMGTEKSDAQYDFALAARKMRIALKPHGILALVMKNYLPKSRQFLVGKLEDAGFVKKEESRHKEGKKEGLAIIEFVKGRNDANAETYNTNAQKYQMGKRDETSFRHRQQVQVQRGAERPSRNGFGASRTRSGRDTKPKRSRSRRG